MPQAPRNAHALLAPIDVQSTDGRSVAIGDLISGRRSVLVFVRHFG
jgi:hypothetical protein